MYCTEADVKAMLKEDVISSILGVSKLPTQEEKEARLAPLLAAAVGDAAAEIDGYLCKRYPTPLATTPAMIAKVAKDIAVYNIMSRSGIDTGERESNYLTRYNAAVKYLTMAAKGDVDIGIAAPVSSPTAQGQSTFCFHNDKPIFGRNKMSGM